MRNHKHLCLWSCLTLFVFITGCATQPLPGPSPLGASILSEKVDLDSILPEAKADVVEPNTKAPRFEPMLFSPPYCMAKDLKTGSTSLQPCQEGFLVDEITFSQQNISDQAKLHELITIQNNARTFFDTTFTSVRAAEITYQKRVVDLDLKLREAQVPTFWSRIAYPTGVLTGIVLTIAIVYAVGQLK